MTFTAQSLINCISTQYISGMGILKKYLASEKMDWPSAKAGWASDNYTISCPINQLIWAAEIVFGLLYMATGNFSFFKVFNAASCIGTFYV